MSVKISNSNKITLTRGDSLSATVSMIMSDGEPYVPIEGDSIRFALKHPKMNKQGTEYADPEPLLVKSIPNETLELKLDPGDTSDLGFGEYVYDIELTHANGDVDTFIAAKEFELTPEVY